MNITELLTQKGLIIQSPNEEEILDRAKSLDKPLKILYGETYDEEGNPIDSMKYYFFVSMLSKALKEKGIETDPVILVADVAACRNVSEKLKEKFIKLGEKRVNFIEKIKNIYNLDIKIIKMSNYLFDKEFQKKLDKIKNIYNNNSELMKKIESTVPGSKLKIEREKDFAYSFDEIGTIIDVDIKVGPPREDLYDSLARETAKFMKLKPLISIYLTPTFPIGVNFDYYISHPGIEECGITAYKAGSKRMQDHRIIIGKLTLDEIKKLIENSFVSENSEIPNPVLDIGIISEMARINLEGNNESICLYDDFYSKKININDLKIYIYKLLIENIINKLK